MKFKMTIVHGKGEDATKQIVEIDGDLDAVKTYLKLVISIKEFNWGAVERADESNLVAGDVNRWLIRKNWTIDTLELSVFSFHDVDPLINVNAYIGSFEPKPGMKAVNKLLGGGKF